MNCKQTSFGEISYLLRRAKCCLVLRRFEEVVHICDEVLQLKDFGRVPEKWTPFVVIALQAYAEINQVKAAVKFASRVFGNPQKFPPVVLELCICLFLKASEYGAADDLAEKWLECEENFLEQKYFEITELYIKHVLLPQGLHQNIEQFLETNKALSSEQKQALHTTSGKLFSEKLESCSNPTGSDSCKTAVYDKQREKQGVHCAVVLRALAVLEKLQRFCRSVCCSQWQTSVTILRILILLFFVYALVLAASGYQGVTPGTGLFIFWQGVLKAWRAMFSPYHMV